MRRDLRLFTLLSAPGADLFPTGNWTWVECDSDLCAQLSLDGDVAVELGFTDDGLGYTLESVEVP